MPAVLDKLKLNRRRIAFIAGAAGLAALTALIFYLGRIGGRISKERELLAAAARVKVQETRLRAPATGGVRLYVNAPDVRAVAALRGVRYLATSGGLAAVDETGNLTRLYTTLDGLPDNDLTALAVFAQRLFIGSKTAGLVSFDGEVFSRYVFIEPRAVHISVLVPWETELLIGTLDGGLFEYDGERFSRRFNSASGAEFSRVTALLPIESRLYIGTQDRGLYIWREAHIEHVTTSDGLPSPRVTGLAQMPGALAGAGQIAAATDFGVVGLGEDNHVTPLAAQPNVTSLAVSGGRLWAGLFSGGLIDLSARSGPPERAAGGRSVGISGLPNSAPTIVSGAEGRLWALTQEGAFVRDPGAAGPGFEQVASALAADRLLTAGHITALVLDGEGRLWVGYFDRGVDVLALESGERLSHIEDDRLREVNAIAFDPHEDRMLVATSAGLVIIDRAQRQTVLTREQSGLVSNVVAHVSIASASGTPPIAVTSRGLMIATAGGLTQVSAGRARSITAFHGLASNHLYTSAVAGSRIYLGSLAGLIELEGLRVLRAYKTSNSHLSHDWVTALAQSEGTLYIGTNGGGVDALLPTGEWVNFSTELGKFEVNQNAMHYDGERLYVGTTDRGLFVYNTRARLWKRISEGLPSQSVTAIASDDQFIYAGTLNGLMRIEKRVVD